MQFQLQLPQASACFVAQRSQHFESARWGMDGDCLRGAAGGKRAREKDGGIGTDTG